MGRTAQSLPARPLAGRGPLEANARSAAWNVGVAVACVGVAVVARLAIAELLGSRTVFLTFFPAVVGATLLAGLWSGVTATGMSLLLSHFWTLPARKADPGDVGDLVQIFLFAFIAGLMVLVAELSNRAKARRVTSEQQLRLITDTLPALISYVGTDCRYRSVNRAYNDWFAAPAAPLVGRHLLDVMGPERYEQVRPYVERALAGEHVVFTDRWRYPDGVERDIEVEYAPHAGDDGRPEGFAVLVTDVTERRRSAERIGELNAELRQRVAQLEALMSVLPVGIAVAHDPACARVTIDPQFATLLGVPPGTNISQTAAAAAGQTSGAAAYRVLLDGQEVPPAERPMERAAAGQKPPVQELEVRRADGRTVWLMVSAAPVLGDHGEPAGAIAAHVDVTELHRARAAAAESEGRFRMMADSSPALVWVADPAHGRVWFNKSWLAFVGRPMEQDVGDGWAQSVHPEDLPAFARTYNEAFDARRRFAIDYRLLRHDGVYRWVLANGVPLYGPDGSFAGYLGTCLDVGDMRAARDELAKSEERFRRSVLEAPVPILIHADDGSVVEVSKSWSRLTGYDRAEIPTTRAWADLATATGDGEPAADGPLDALMNDACRSQAALQDAWELDVRTKWGGDRRWVLSTAPLGVLQDGRRLQVTTAVDVTDRYELERHREALLTSERAARAHAEAAAASAERIGRMKDEFLATLSHELRTPLNAILGWAQLLQRAPGDQDALAEGVDAILRNARAQTQLVSDLLDMSRIVAGTLRLDVRPANPADVVSAAIASVRPSAELKGVRVDVDLDPSAGPVAGDPSRLQQVVWNLLTNAVKFTPAGGTIRVSLRRDGDDAALTVSDTGAGIPADFLPYIFERFRQADASTTRKHGGLGLGLSIAKQIVELHNGTIRAESPGDGHGSTFTVTFPVAAAARPAPHDDAVHGGGAVDVNPVTDRPSRLLAGLSVLVVDDDPDARALARRVLGEHAAIVRTAASADEAMERFADAPPDVLISDIGMPGRDGYELLRAVRELPPEAGGEVPAAAVTAFARAEDRDRALVAGYHAHLSKPIEPPALVAIVARLAGRGAADGDESREVEGDEERSGPLSPVFGGEG